MKVAKLLVAQYVVLPDIGQKPARELVTITHPFIPVFSYLSTI